jgi:hypothetical protein
MKEEKYWSYHTGLRKWVQVNESGLCIYVEDLSSPIFLTRRQQIDATGPNPPTEIPKIPSDLEEIEVTVVHTLEVNLTKEYGIHFDPNNCYFSEDEKYHAWNTPKSIKASIVGITGFDKKYKCNWCDGYSTNEEPHVFQLCRCGGIGYFKAWTPKMPWKVGEVFTPEVAC